MKERKECASCGAGIYWLKTLKDKNIPVDADELEGDYPTGIPDDLIFEKAVMKCHFETCPNAKEHRAGYNARTSAAPPTNDAGVNARRLNTALAVLEDIVKNPPDGMRSVELAKAGLSQVRAIR